MTHTASVRSSARHCSAPAIPPADEVPPGNRSLERFPSEFYHMQVSKQLAVYAADSQSSVLGISREKAARFTVVLSFWQSSFYGAAFQGSSVFCCHSICQQQLAEARFLVFNHSVTCHKPITYLCRPECSGFEHVLFVREKNTSSSAEQRQNSTSETKEKPDVTEVMTRCFRVGGLSFLQFFLAVS